MSELEELKEIGSFGLTCDIAFSILEIDYGDGHDDSSLVGSSLGTRSWKLVYKTLPGTMDSPVQVTDALLESRADYLWNFFCRRKAEGNSSFILTCPRDGKRYLAKFVEHKLSYEMFATKLFSSGLSIQQRREAGVSMDVDGSLGADTGNPDAI
jgi:hypothetical protein